MLLLAPHWTRRIEKGANNHEQETQEHEPEPYTQVRRDTKASQDSTYVPYQKLNGQPYESSYTSPGDHSRRKVSNKAGSTRPYNEKYRQQGKRQYHCKWQPERGIVQFKVWHVIRTHAIAEEHGEENHPVDD